MMQMYVKARNIEHVLETIWEKYGVALGIESRSKFPWDAKTLTHVRYWYIDYVIDENVNVTRGMSFISFLNSFPELVVVFNISTYNEYLSEFDKQLTLNSKGIDSELGCVTKI